MKYKDQLQDSRWKAKRLKIIARAESKCEACGVSEPTLNVHHKVYTPGKMAWEYPDDNFVCLCSHHHKLQHIPSCCETQLFKRVYDRDMRKDILVPLYALYCPTCGSPIIPGA